MINLRDKKSFNYIILFIATFIFGTIFVVSKVLLNSHVPPIFMIAVRNVVGFLLMLSTVKALKHKIGKEELIWGSLVGVLMLGIRILQFVGAEKISPTDSVMLGSLYVVFVPLISMFTSKKWDVLHLICAGIAFIGVLVLVDAGNHQMNSGDVLTLGSAILLALQIIFIDKKVQSLQVTSFVCVQFMVQAALAVVGSVILEHNNYTQIVWSGNVVGLLVYLAVCGTFLADFLQEYAQKKISSDSASLILSSQTLIGVILSVVVGLDKFSINLVFGSFLILLAILMSEFSKAILYKIKEELVRIKA